MVGVVVGIYIATHPKPEPRVTTTVENGPVRQIVAVSGVADAKDRADLAFPVVGVTRAVLAEVGDVVETGEILAILDTSTLETDRQEALAGLTSAVAERGELVAGQTSEAKAVTDTTVQLKEASLATTKLVESNKVVNAKRTLLSSELTAYTKDIAESAVPPEVSGTYSCDKEGSYLLEVYRSDSASGYSFRLSGLESGSFSAAVDQPGELGTCGLKIQFDADSIYGNSTWHIDIPNKTSATYTLNKNAYELALVQASSTIALSEQEVALAKATAATEQAAPRSEALIRADAKVTAAQARVARVEAEIANRVMRAPFSGTITTVSIKNGETASTEPIMSIVAKSDFEITARIPEIDIGKLAVGQKATMVFDAKSDETVTGTITFISLQATNIDGVAYFEAYMSLDQTPAWMRSGLNADIDIIVAEKTDHLRLPKRFLISTDSGHLALKQTGDTIASTTVNAILFGNDGYVAIEGLTKGDIVVAP
jgi:multidrug efflux pump subunit AcrA (membrane-fusion protein)